MLPNLGAMGALVMIILAMVPTPAHGQPSTMKGSASKKSLSAKGPLVIDVRTIMDAATLRRTGLSKLSEEELFELNGWLKDFAMALVKDRGRSPSSAMSGSVVSAVNDETFVIETIGGRAIFKARTYCFGVNDGDQVVFTKSPNVCVSNTFVTKSGNKCDVWCE